MSPADGKVILIDDEKKRIDIFMGVTDVHVNRAPLKGKVKRIRRERGGHAPAYSDESEKNEKLTISLGTEHGPVDVTQIVGIIARRIVPYVEKGDVLRKGERIGMIRFGSRVRLEFPGPVKFHVKEGDRVRAGETTLGVWHGR